ncbi:hypothetical protein AVEN_148184-1 [Araneus ventricosus]|uniref:MSP domain-containing protein n=1 Tax=Araneus ventricosus TaxID=182803 RepID=A0A4Y2DBN8_ARAVE|nr:hypothetical protein AVEN_148184-1 [Araneus ventricosus]
MVSKSFSETTLVVQNPEKSSVEWDIRPFSMLFTQSIEDSLNLSNVLQVLPSSGVLQSKEKANIVVKFMPSNPDCFYRFFELSLNFSNGVKKKCNFQISGSSICLTENAELNKSPAVARLSKKKPRTDIYIENEICEFPKTSVGKNCSAFVKVNNPSMQDYKLNITKPQLPFIVQQSSVLVRSKMFLKIPVNFMPTKTAAMDYEDVLILQSEIGHEFVIKLKETHKSATALSNEYSLNFFPLSPALKELQWPSNSLGFAVRGLLAGDPDFAKNRQTNMVCKTVLQFIGHILYEGSSSWGSCPSELEHSPIEIKTFGCKIIVYCMLFQLWNNIQLKKIPEHIHWGEFTNYSIV